jgi:hypothetical protein
MKYVQIRFESYRHHKAINEIKHDTRDVKPTYLCQQTDYFHNQYNNVILIPDSFGRLKSVDITEENRKELTLHQMQSYHQSRREHNRLYKQRHGQNLRDSRDNSFLAGVITLSHIIEQELKEGKISKQELEITFRKALSNVEHGLQQYGVKRIEYATIHYDEKTPHLHFYVKNFDNEGLSIYHKIRKKKKLSGFQDEVGLAFSTLGYSRGQRKTVDGNDHASIRRAHQLEIEELKQEIQKLKGQKQRIKQNGDLKIAQKKQEYEKIDVMLKATRTKVKSIKEAQKQNRERAEQIVKRGVNMFGVADRQQLTQEIATALDSTFSREVAEIAQLKKSYMQEKQGKESVLKTLKQERESREPSTMEQRIKELEKEVSRENSEKIKINLENMSLKNKLSKRGKYEDVIERETHKANTFQEQNKELREQVKSLKSELDKWRPNISKNRNKSFDYER